MEEQKDVLILAIESSCDETAAAVVKNGRTILSNIINSQIAIHTEYGGVVPEIASRKHIENINPVIRMALDEAGVTLDDIDAIGVTYGPGLVGALLVGVAEAKAIAFATGKPLVGVHHIEGHIAANYIENKNNMLESYRNSHNSVMKHIYLVSAKEKIPKHNLYIFGHSLDITDRDVLRLFICNDNVQTKIFYYRENEEDKRTLGRLIKNLIQIIGQEELIKRTGGLHKTIEFIPQAIS